MLRYLWQIRTRPSLFSATWLRVWAKRGLTLRAVLGAAHRAERLRRAGARIGTCVFISPADIAGSLERLRVGDESFLGRIQVQVHSEIRIGSRVCINDRAQIFSATHRLDDPEWESVAKPVVIEDYAWVATGAMVLPGVRVGRGAVIGAGAVVSRDVPAFALAVGNPARVIENKRVRELDYSPVSHLAGYRAWAGINAPQNAS